jgi:hypothetical protein
MDYKTLLNKLPKETELHYLSDCTQFFKENNLNINDYKKWNYMLFQYTIDDFDSTIKSLDNNNIDYTIKTDFLDLYYILIK